MKIKLTADYNEHHKKGGDGDGLADDLKRKLVKVGLAEAVKPAPSVKTDPAPAKPKAKPKAKGRTAARLAAAAPEGHRPLAGDVPTPEPEASE